MKSYPGLKNFSDEKLAAFLAEPFLSWFSDYQKSELQKAPDKDKYYMDALKAHYIDEANEKAPDTPQLPNTAPDIHDG